MRNTTLTTLRMRLEASLLALTLLALPLGATAAGLGKLTVLSALGQPLRAEVDISASREELSSLTARTAPPAAFQRAGIEYSPTLAAIRFSIDQRPDGQPFLSMASERAFNEPFLDLLVELSWSSGRLVREYTFLLDPPESLQKQQGAPAAALALPEIRREAPPVAAPSPAAPPPVALPPPPSSASQPEAHPALPAEEKAPKKPRPDMQVVRGADGVQRIVKAEPPAAEKPVAQPATRQVNRGDTLGKIAAETKPEGVNLDQMLVALFRSNQDAFSGNVNRLKAGKILAIPDRDTAAGIDADEARKTIQAHSADFNAYSKKLAATVANAPAQEDAPKRAVSGKIAPKVEEKAPVTAGKDKLEVSKSEVATDAAGKAGARRIAAIEETLVSREKALKDANSRIAELEKNLKDLQKLVELKNQSMADLQKQAQAAKPATPPPVKEPVAAPAKPVAKTVERPAESVQASPPKPAAPVPPIEVAKPAEPAAAAKPTEPTKPPATEKKPVPPPPPAAPAELSFADESPEIVYGGSAILALLLAYLGYSRWRKQKQAASQDSGGTGELAENLPAAGSAAAEPAQPTEDLLSPADFGSQSGDAGVDPIAEADVYLAYGRDVQAEEILIDALKNDPTRLAIHLKLLEVYAARNSVKQFEAIARDVHGLTGGSGTDWEKVRQLALPIDPDNPLYAMAPAAPAEFDPDATLVTEPSPTMAELPAVEPAAEDLAPSMLADLAEPVIEQLTQEEVPASLDFDFNLPLAEQVSAPEEPEPAKQEEVPGSLSMDLDLAADFPATLEPAMIEAPVAASESPAPQEASQSLDVDFDLDLGAQTPAAAAAPAAADVPATTPADSGVSLDFDFELGGGDTPAIPAQAEPVDIPLPAEPTENVIDFDLELPEPAATEKPAAPPFDMASINLDLDAPLEPKPPAVTPPAVEAPAELDDSALQDVATKLELAQAYEEMGDKEGARELLQEVLNEGNAAQQETARNKLAQLG